MSYYLSNYIKSTTKNTNYNLLKFYIKTNLFITYYSPIIYFNLIKFNINEYNTLIKIYNNVINNIYVKSNYYFKRFITKNLIEILNKLKKNTVIAVTSKIKNIYDTITNFIDVPKSNFIHKKKLNISSNLFPVYLNSDELDKNLITNKLLKHKYNLKHIQLLNNNKLLYKKNINKINILINKIFKKKLNNIQYDFYTKAQKLILGQDNILIKISAKLINIDNIKSHKPIANWLLCGPSGTGKTELAKILARYINTYDDNIVHINMSELQERHSVSKLLGSPPGYVGNKDCPSEVIDKVIKNPKSIVLFDEVEKAHKNIYPIFLQILEDGTLTSSTNVKAKFNEAFIVFTSNLGSTALDKNNFNNLQKITYNSAVKKEIEHHFTPELINRLDDILIFNPLDPYISYKLILDTVKDFKKFIYHDSAKLLTCIQLSSPLQGARFIFNTIDKTFSNKEHLNNLIIKYNKNIKCLNLIK